MWLFLTTGAVNKNIIKQKKIVQTIIDIIFEEFLTLYQNFFSPQGKRSIIISNKHGVYELPHELLNDLKLRTLGS